jgi:hypothetical protein
VLVFGLFGLGRGYPGEELASASCAVGVAGQCDDFGVMDETVDHRGSDDVVGEDLAPPKGIFEVTKMEPCS